MKYSIVSILLLLLSAACIASAQTVTNWKPYFTLDPGEGTEWVLDTVPIIPKAGVPTVNLANDGRLYLGAGYYTGGGQGRSVLEITANGRSYVAPAGNYQRTMHIDGGFIYLPDGRTRFVTEEPSPDNTPLRHKSRIISWISTDGLNWTREQGIRYQPVEPDDSIASVPSAIQVRDSVWRMYYVGDFYNSNGARTAISTDWGLTWTRESNGNILGRGDVDPQPVYLSNGRIRLYLRTGLGAKPPAASGVAYCDSDDGLHFDPNDLHLVIPDTTNPPLLKLDPNVVRFPNGDIACYIGGGTLPASQDDPALLVAWAKKPSVGVPAMEVLSTGRAGSRLSVFPNPASSNCIVRLKTLRGGHVHLGLVNLMGMEVRVLTEGNVAAGDQRIPAGLADVGTGVYFLRMTIGDETIVCPLLLR